MDKLWYRNPSKSEVIDLCVAGMKNPNDHEEPTKSNVKKTKTKTTQTF